MTNLALIETQQNLNSETQPREVSQVTDYKSNICKMNKNSKIFIVKRNGDIVTPDFNAVLQRIGSMCEGLNADFVDPAQVAQKTINGIVANMTTAQIDDLSASVASNMVYIHPDYGLLAGRLIMSNLQKKCPKTFSESIRIGWEAGVIADDVYEFVRTNKAILNSSIRPKNDLNYNAFAATTLKNAYLLRANGDLIETPQYAFMRVAVGIHAGDVDKAIDTYNMLSSGMYIHSSPTIFNAGTKMPQMASCFLVDMQDDSIYGIFTTLRTCALISKMAGGIGLTVSKVRSKGCRINGTNGESAGIIPMLRCFNSTARYVNQAGRRKGSFAIFIQPHHPDLLDFLELKNPFGDEELRTRDLFTAIYASNLFFKRVETPGALWTFFDPVHTAHLNDLYDDHDDLAYTREYERLEKEGTHVVRQMQARDVWNTIINNQLKSGVPYITNKDRVNETSNHKNLGPIRSSNLCNEIVQYSSPDETAVCNLASICLPKFTNEDCTDVDCEKIAHYTGKVVENLNKVIDRSCYPTDCSKRSNERHRPVGVGVSGLADLFWKLRIPFDSTKAREVNKKIFESMYFGALRKSVDLAKEYGHYESYLENGGCPLSRGQLNCDLWDTKPALACFDWDGLRQDLAKYGARSSLHIALMPTATSSTILGVNEAFEPVTSNMYMRKTLSGEFFIVNRFLVEDLCKRGLWDDNGIMAKRIRSADGSIAEIDSIPDDIKALYKTVWEMGNRSIIDMAAERSPWVDQSQSMNLFLSNPTPRQLSSMYFYAQRKKLKTIVYYLRMQTASTTSHVGLRNQETGSISSNEQNEEECLACSA